MEEAELHVHHGHHDHQPAGGLGQRVALFTALLAALGAVLGYQSNRLMDEVLLQKNDAVLLKAHATDQWNYYQAVSTKLHLMELAKVLSATDKQQQFDTSIAKYKKQKADIKTLADRYESASAKANADVARLDAPHNLLAMAMIMFQIAVALASITALTQRGWLLLLAAISAVAGIGLWAYGMSLI